MLKKSDVCFFPPPTPLTSCYLYRYFRYRFLQNIYKSRHVFAISILVALLQNTLDNEYIRNEWHSDDSRWSKYELFYSIRGRSIIENPDILEELDRLISRENNWHDKPGIGRYIKILENSKGNFAISQGRGRWGFVWRRKYFETDRRIGIFRTRGKQSCMIRHSHRGFRSKSLRSAGS